MTVSSIMATPTADLQTLSLHDALPIFPEDAAAVLIQTVDLPGVGGIVFHGRAVEDDTAHTWKVDRKSTRLNSSHRCSSYAVSCLKKRNAGWPRCSAGCARRRGRCVVVV